MRQISQRRALFFLFLAASLLSGCSAYQASQSDEAGGFRSDGTYRLSESERQQGCKSLNGWLLGYVDEHRHLELARQRQTSLPPKTLLASMSRAAGVAEQTSARDQVCLSYARIRAYGQEMVRKGCPPKDIDALLIAGRAAVPAIARTEQGAPAIWGGPRWTHKRTVGRQVGEAQEDPEAICARWRT